MLTSAARETLAGVQTVIVDEVHAVAATKRGAHLALSLERLDALLEQARAADRPVGDGPAARGGGAIPVRRGADDDRRAAGRQDLRPDRAGPGSRHGEPGEQLHLARRRGTHRRPGRGAQLVDRVRQLAAAGRAADRPAQRDSRRTHRSRAGRAATPEWPAARPRTSWPADRPTAPNRCWPAPTTARSARNPAPRSRTRSRPGGSRPWSPPPAWNSESTWAQSIW